MFGSFILAAAIFIATIAGASPDYLTLRNEQMKISESGYNTAFEASCKMQAELYSRCIIAEKPEACADLHIREDEHANIFEGDIRTCRAPKVVAAPATPDAPETYMDDEFFFGKVEGNP